MEDRDEPCDAVPVTLPVTLGVAVGVKEGMFVPDLVMVPVSVGETVLVGEAPWLGVWEEVLLFDGGPLGVRETDNVFEGVLVVVLVPLGVPDIVTVPVKVGDTVPDVEAPWLGVWEEVLLLEVDVLRVRVTDDVSEGVPVVVLELLRVGEVDRDDPCDAVPVTLSKLMMLDVPVRELVSVGVTERLGVPERDSVREGVNVREGV